MTCRRPGVRINYRRDLPEPGRRRELERVSGGGASGGRDVAGVRFQGRGTRRRDAAARASSWCRWANSGPGGASPAPTARPTNHYTWIMGVLSKRFLERLRSGPPLLLDAAMGTELQRRDANTTLPLWSARTLIDDPELVWTIHGDEVAAGADIVTANTFRTHARTLAKAGLGARAAELSALAVRLAHQAAVGAGARGLRRGLAVAARGLLPARPRAGAGGGRARARGAGALSRRGGRGPDPGRDAQHDPRGGRGDAGGEGDRACRSSSRS